MKNCLHCKNDFKPKHGNQLYCSESCKQELKTIKQRENNALLKQFKSGFLSNYKLFQELHPQQGHFSISLFRLLKHGFDQYAYYGTAVDEKGSTWHKVNEYMFSIITSKDQPLLNLYKS
jgi:predicted nucleic acid-binding Zn ribbon protein